MLPAPLRPPARASVRLVHVSADNHNKVYEMTEQGDGTFEARFGRVGARLQSCTYPMARWEGIYREKTRKGYRDLTPLAAADGAPAGFAIDDPAVAALVAHLRRAADAALRAQYLVGPGDVGAGQVAEAQACLDALAALAGALDGSAAPARAFDDALVALYTVIPRRMADVRRHLLGGGLAPDAVPALLDAEQDALDRMAQRVRLDGQPARPTLREALGVDLRPATDAERARIEALVGDAAVRVEHAVAVDHPAQRARFAAHVAAADVPRTQLLWHGSRTENWLSILENGLQLHPGRAVITGKMFGHGLYFADAFPKSLGYTSLRGAGWTAGGAERGVLGLYDVHLGRTLPVRLYRPSYGALTAETLPRHRFRPVDAVHARRGAMLRHDEFVVYREAQACPRYLVSVRQA